MTVAKIGDAQVTEAKLANTAVTTLKLADGAVTGPKLGVGVLTSAMIADGSITTVKLLDANVTNAKLATDAKVGSLAALVTTDKTSAVAGINEAVGMVGNRTTLTTTAKDSVVNAINEVDADATLALTRVGNTAGLTTTATGSAVLAINELDADIGDRTALLTTVKTSLVLAANELWGLIGDRTLFNTTSKDHVRGALNELVARIDALVAAEVTLTALVNATAATATTSGGTAISQLTHVANSVPIASIGGDGVTTTVTTTAPHEKLDSDYDAISGTTNYNGNTGAINVLSTTQFTYASAVNAATETTGFTSTKRVYVASSAPFTLLQQIVVTNDNGVLHPTTVAAVVTGLVTLTDPIPTTWTGAAKASIGRTVSSTIEEVRLSRTVGNPLISKALPEVLTIINRKLFLPRRYDFVGDGTVADTAKLQGMFDAMSSGGRAHVDGGTYTLRRPVLVGSSLDLQLASDAQFRPYVFGTTVSVGGTTGANVVGVTLVSGFANGDKLFIELDSGAFHYPTITGIAGSNITFSPVLPSATSPTRKIGISWASTALFKAASKSNVLIHGGVLDGQKLSTAYGVDTNLHGRLFGIVIDGCSNIVVADMVIKDMPGQDLVGVNGGDGMLFSGTLSEHCTIERVTFSGNVRQGISVTNSVRDLTVHNSRFLDTSGSGPGAGIDLEPDSGGALIEAVTISDSYFSGNNFGICALPIAANIRDLKILGNHLRAHRDPAMDIRCVDFLINDNTIDVYRDNAISLYGAKRGRITNNIIRGTLAQTPDYGQHGVFLRDVEAITIAHNDFSTLYSTAIWMEGRAAQGAAAATVYGLRILYNTFKDITEQVSAGDITVNNGTGVIEIITDGTQQVVNAEIVGNKLDDTRSGAERVDFGILSSGPSAAEEATWVVDLNDGRNIPIMHSGLTVKGRTLAIVSGSLNFGTIAAGAVSEVDVAFTGVAPGDRITASPTAGIGTSAVMQPPFCNTAGNVRLRMVNPTAGNITPTSQTWLIEVNKYT